MIVTPILQVRLIEVQRLAQVLTARIRSLTTVHTAPPWTTEPLTIIASAKKEGTRHTDAELRPGSLNIGPRLGRGPRRV